MIRAGIACALLFATAAGAREVPTDWRKVATAQDRARLRQWRTAWMLGADRTRTAGGGAVLAGEGALFDPDRALADARPPAGDYRCRVFKLGAKTPGLPARPAFACRIDAEGDLASFHKTGGAQRPVGLIFDDTQGRAVFLGTMMLGDETRAVDYGRDAARDMAGFVERVGERRWRIVLPYPRFESILDVIELVPA